MNAQGNTQVNANQKPGSPAPAPAPAQQGGPAPAQQGSPAPAQRTVAKNPAELKQQIKTQFGMMFGSDSDFTISKTYSTIAQGFRFRLDRQKGTIRTLYIPISKKGGLMKPGLLECEGKVKGIMVIHNILTGKPALTMTEDAKTRTWSLVNNEAGNAPCGQVKVVQDKDNITFSFVYNGQASSSISVFCPVRKGGMCSSPKPAALHSVKFQGKFRSGITFEENPNGDLCKDDLEINAVFNDTMSPDMLEFISLVGVMQAMAVELY